MTKYLNNVVMLQQVHIQIKHISGIISSYTKPSSYTKLKISYKNIFETYKNMNICINITLKEKGENNFFFPFYLFFFFGRIFFFPHIIVNCLLY